jgi:acyl-CoA thioesterase FadM
VAHDIGGPDRAEALLRPEGMAFILKSMEVKYRRPVRFPDTVSRNSFAFSPGTL